QAVLPATAAPAPWRGRAKPGPLLRWCRRRPLPTGNRDGQRYRRSWTSPLGIDGNWRCLSLTRMVAISRMARKSCVVAVQRRAIYRQSGPTKGVMTSETVASDVQDYKQQDQDGNDTAKYLQPALGAGRCSPATR